MIKVSYALTTRPRRRYQCVIVVTCAAGTSESFTELNGTPIGSEKLQSAQLPCIAHRFHNILDAPCRSTEVTKRTRCGWINWMNMSEVQCSYTKVNILNISICVAFYTSRAIWTSNRGPTFFSGLFTHMKRHEVTNMKMCRWLVTTH